jgi:hypothetical protein
MAFTGHILKHTPHFVHFFTLISCFAVSSKTERASSFPGAFTDM